MMLGQHRAAGQSGWRWEAALGTSVTASDASRVIVGYRDTCRDCGLVHTMDFKIVDGDVWLRAPRGKWTTAAARRAKQKQRPQPKP
jgi:hypothetical protein